MHQSPPTDSIGSTQDNLSSHLTNVVVARLAERYYQAIARAGHRVAAASRAGRMRQWLAATGESSYGDGLAGPGGLGIRLVPSPEKGSEQR